jgi:N-acetyl-beta-hexosaminidase
VDRGLPLPGLIEQGVVAGVDRLQAYFETRLEAMVRARGRRLIAWDEALVSEDPATPSERLSSDAAFMYWRDFMTLPARLYDRDWVATPFTRLYLDYRRRSTGSTRTSRSRTD